MYEEQHRHRELVTEEEAGGEDTRGLREKEDGFEAWRGEV